MRLALHERESVFSNALSEPGRLSPPIWPCTTRGFPCLRDCYRSGGLLPHLFTLTGFASSACEDRPRRFSFGLSPGYARTGGLFSVALSVNSSTASVRDFSSASTPAKRAAKGAQTQVCATAPLALPGALPFTLGLAAQGFPLLSQRGVRTFLPASLLAKTSPAITRLTRHSYYTPRNCADQEL